MNREPVAVPVHQRQFPKLLTLGAGIGMILFLIGLFLLHLWLSVVGGTVAVPGKLWFADRMVWLMKR